MQHIENNPNSLLQFQSTQYVNSTSSLRMDISVANFHKVKVSESEQMISSVQCI